ncbi:MAG: GNAT family N-acetyltransferase [Alphaproteobacteria bacterium]|nr:GNAT family N-acetyltransferase [Alphaproteobacteria bacterium]
MPAETSTDAAALTIAKFDKALHDRSAFSCGFGPIDNFLKSSLSDQIRNGMVAAWIATAGEDPAVLGFYTLGAMVVRADLGPKKWQSAGVPDIPVIYIRAVAVREDMQGKGLGTALVVDAMRRCLGIADQMGAAAIVLDVLKDEHFERRWYFYEDLGFKPPGDAQNPERVFISLANVRATFEHHRE